MRNMKKIICFILCTVMLIMPLGNACAEQTEEVSEKIAALKDFGILQGYVFDNKNVENTLTRADLAVIAMQIIGLDNEVSANTDTRFYDVEKEYWASGYIESAAKLGFLSGDLDNKFYPEDSVSKNSAVKVIMSVLGYGELAEKAGGYPTGYLKYASKYDLTKGISFENEASLTMSEMLAMSYNALSIPILKQYSFGSVERFETDKTKTVLSEYFDIYKAEGVVLGNDLTILGETGSLGAYRVKIGDNILNEGTTDIKNYLGCNVSYYYKENASGAESRVVSFSVKQSEIYEIFSNKINEYKNGQFSFFDENGKIDEIKVSPAVDVIFNGKYKAYYTPEDLKPLLGKVRLTDTDSDGRADVISVESAVTYLVEKTDADQMTVYDTYGQKPLKLKASKGRRITITKDGINAEFAQIQQGDVLTVLADKLTKSGNVLTVSEEAEFINAYITQKSTSGILCEIYEKEIRIDESVYNVSPAFLLSDEFKKELSVKIGEKISVVFDSFGNVAGTTESAPKNTLFGYVAGCDNKKAFGTALEMFEVKTSSWKKFDLAKNVELDGSFVSAQEAIKGLKTDAEGNALENILPQLIIYELNANNEIDYIDTATVSSKEIQDITLSKGIAKGSYRYHKASKSFGGKFAVNNDSVLLFIPENESGEADITNPEGFVIGNTGMFASSGEYKMETYNMDEGIAEVVIRYYSKNEVNDTVLPYTVRDLAMVDEIVSAVHNGEVTKKIYAYAGGSGSKLEIYCDEDTTIVDQKSESSSEAIKLSALKKGDVIRYSMGMDLKTASRIERILSLKTGDTYTPLNKEQYLMRRNSTNSYFSNYLLTYGILYTNKNGLVQVTFNENGEEDFYVYSLTVTNGKNVVLYDEEKDEIKIVPSVELDGFMRTESYKDTVRIAVESGSGTIYAVFAYMID